MQLAQTMGSDDDFNEVNNRTMEYTSRSGTLATVQAQQHPKTEYEQGFYHP